MRRLRGCGRRRVWAARLQAPWDFEGPPGSGGYALLLVDVDGAVSPDEQRELSRRIVETGCRYAVCFGPTSGRWDDSIDMVSVMDGIDGVPRDLVMTSWHDDEPLEETVDFFHEHMLIVGDGDDGRWTPERYLVLVLGGTPGREREVVDAVRARFARRRLPPLWVLASLAAVLVAVGWFLATPHGYEAWCLSLDELQPRVEPVADALEAFREERGGYPGALAELVEGDLLDELPELDVPRGASDVFPLTYERAPDGSFFVLRFGAMYSTGVFPEAVERFYISDTDAWDTRSYPPTLEELVAARARRTSDEVPDSPAPPAERDR